MCGYHYFGQVLEQIWKKVQIPKANNPPFFTIIENLERSGPSPPGTKTPVSKNMALGGDWSFGSKLAQ